MGILSRAGNSGHAWGESRNPVTTIASITEMQRISEKHRMEGKRIGLVPTMGYLHKGHVSLIDVARLHSDIIITSIFVNPTQFAPTEDFTKYPRDIGRDTQLAADAHCDYLFVPTTEEMYPHGYQTYVQVERVTEFLEGR